MRKVLGVFTAAVLLTSVFTGCESKKSETVSQTIETSSEAKSAPEATFDDLKCGMTFDEMQLLFGEPSNVNLDPDYPNADAYIWKFEKLNLIADEGKKATLSCYFSENKLNYAEMTYTVDVDEADQLCDSWLNEHMVYGLKEGEWKKITPLNGFLTYINYGYCLKLTLKNMSINSFQDDPKKFKKLKCGMSRSDVEELLGEPHVVKTYGDYWYFKNNGTFSGTKHDPDYTMIACNYCNGSLYDATYFLEYTGQGKISLTSVASDIQSSSSPFNGYAGDIPHGDKTIEEKYNAKDMSVIAISDAVCINISNYDYYKSNKTDDNTSDGKVGDNNNNGKIDENDWEIEWKDYLDKNMN